MQRRPVASSSIRSVGYDAMTSALEVEFVDGSVYRYFAVPRGVHDALLSSGSVGRAFNLLVRGHYPWTPA